MSGALVADGVDVESVSPGLQLTAETLGPSWGGYRLGSCRSIILSDSSVLYPQGRFAMGECGEKLLVIS